MKFLIIQGYHWSKKQATVHPFSVTYFEPREDKLVEKFYVVISDTMNHNADTFNTFKFKVMELIKDELAHVSPSHIIFLSDGCGGQYKNRKNLAHLMEFYNDFGMTTEWIFTGEL